MGQEKFKKEKGWFLPMGKVQPMHCIACSVITKEVVYKHGLKLILNA